MTVFLTKKHNITECNPPASPNPEGLSFSLRADRLWIHIVLIFMSVSHFLICSWYGLERDYLYKLQQSSSLSKSLQLKQETDFYRKLIGLVAAPKICWMLLIIFRWKMAKFLVGQFADRLTDAAAVDGEPKNVIIGDLAIPARSATEVLRQIVKFW